MSLEKSSQGQQIARVETQEGFRVYEAAVFATSQKSGQSSLKVVNAVQHVSTHYDIRLDTSQ